MWPVLVCGPRHILALLHCPAPAHAACVGMGPCCQQLAIGAHIGGKKDHAEDADSQPQGAEQRTQAP